MKAVVAAFNQEKALVGAFSVITNLRMELFQALMGTQQAGEGGVFMPFNVAMPHSVSSVSMSNVKCYAAVAELLASRGTFFVRRSPQLIIASVAQPGPGNVSLISNAANETSWKFSPEIRALVGR